MDGMLKVTKVVVGIACGIVVAEGVAIAANAALDDVDDLVSTIKRRVSPPPEPKRGLFKKNKKGGK